MQDREQLETLAKQPKSVSNTEDEILHVDEAIKQSDVLDHLRTATDNGSAKP